MKEEEVFERFKKGTSVLVIGDSGTGVAQGMTRNEMGFLRVLVKWDASGITAETHPSQITPVIKGEPHGRKNHDHNGS